MSVSSTYKIALDIDAQDEARQKLKQMERGFKSLSDAAKQAGNGLNFQDNFRQMEADVDALTSQIKCIAHDSKKEFSEAFKAYQKNASRAMTALQDQSDKLTLSLSDEGKAYREQIKALREKTELTKDEKKELSDLSKMVVELSDEEINSAIQRNKLMRVNLKSAEAQAKYASSVSGDMIKAPLDAIGHITEKLLTGIGTAVAHPILSIKKASLAVTPTIKIIKDKMLNAIDVMGRLPEIAQEWPGKVKKAMWISQIAIGVHVSKIKHKIKSLTVSSVIEKSFQLMGKGIGATFKGIGSAASKIFSFVEKNGKRAFDTFAKGAGKAMAKTRTGLQTIYNTTGLIGGASRTIGSVMSSASGAADKQVDREKQAARIKGSLSDDEKQKLLQQVYIKTGADYGVIVDAINAIQNTFGQKVKSDELAQAAAMEIQYPGTASTFLSSTEGESNMDKFNMYANRLKAIQGATGASTEQIQASTSFVSQFANHKTGASISQLQAVYLAMQNQGVFNSEEELQTAFKRFVSQQATSGMSPVEFASQFDWGRYAKGKDGLNRASNALSTMNWEAVNQAATTNDTSIKPDSEAKSMAEKMRELEEKKNELMMKLIPVVIPVVDELSKLLGSSEGQAIIDGLVGIFKTVLPLLDPIFKVLKVVLDFVNEYLLSPLEKMIRAINDWLGDDEEDEKPQLANGGIATMPSICGERGPEAIIPLEFSRAARATNIATNITQTFHMTGNQTTALSLAQAVRSRDFSRAMTDNQFLANRCGGF
ncbi:MAG: hypothetical protein IKA48_11810 [Fibrobacter sp.]|nr:hypothetical protein [Fibrobacter sp.]